MNILGISGCVGWIPEDAWLHSAGASLFINDRHICTISEERLSRVKHDGRYPELSIKYVLEEGNIDPEAIDIVVYAENIHSPLRRDKIESILKREFENADIEFVDHHVAHASAVFWTSGFETASILTYDGAGNSITTRHKQLVLSETGFFGKGTQKGVVALNHFVNGVYCKEEFNMGGVYNHISREIYSMIEPDKAKAIENPFIFMETAPGKIMGLAAYGEKSVDLPDLFEVNEDSYFPTVHTNYIPTPKQLGKYEPEDLAAWLQDSFENTLVEYFFNLKYWDLLENNLCLAGGCALNVLANAVLMDTKMFDDIFVFPASNDSGLPFGAAIHIVMDEIINDIENDRSLILPDNLASLGKEYSNEEIIEAIKG